MNRADRFKLAGALLCAAGAASCGSSPSGLEVNVDPATFGGEVATLDVILSVPGGFAPQAPGTVDGVGYKVEDRNGDEDAELVARFNGPFAGPFSFRVDTKNKETLDVDATARAFDDALNLFAGGNAHGQLAAGGKGSVAITLAAQTSPVGDDTRTTDLKTGLADVAITSSAAKAPHLSTVAVCNLNGDEYPDIVVGAPAADPGLGIGPTGGVFILMGGATARATIDVNNLGARDVGIFGVNGGDQLGAALACADMDGDTVDDLLVGAPGADLTGDDNAGRIYLIRGGSKLGSTAITLASDTNGAALEWRGGPGNNLGSLFVFSTAGRAQLLAATPGSMNVHLLPVPPPVTSRQVIDVAAPDHFRVTGVVPTALGFGDYDGDDLGQLDIVIGDAQYRAPGDGVDRRGAVYVFSAPDAALASALPIAQAAVMIPGPAVGSQFGAAVLTFDSGHGDDLLIGTPGAGDGAGVIYLFKHGSDFFDVKDRSTTEQSVRTLAAPDGGRFGTALALSQSGTGGGSIARLVVGAPGVTRAGRAQAGAAYAFSANADRAFRLREQLYGATDGGLLGNAVAGGQVNKDDTIGDLLAVAPEMADAGGTARAGAVYVRYASP